ncbi:hypothetical protein BGZ63DRAFT_378458 [Mariannaea sp. PMI_226]|nr:hypothetical protein BGZ63DRAFT_378458 [Mariannaea sp. PMI_226]
MAHGKAGQAGLRLPAHSAVPIVLTDATCGSLTKIIKEGLTLIRSLVLPNQNVTNSAEYEKRREGYHIISKEILSREKARLLPRLHAPLSSVLRTRLRG